MNLEGLNAILTKEEVVATQTAEALLERPREVDEGYKAHVRTYVPLQAGRGEGRLSVEEFSRRLIHKIKDQKAPRGYLSADFGYGKTSTALYLWSQAQQANLIAVPPFQLTRLPSLIVATYGWMDYVLSRSRPGLRDEAEAIYETFAERSLEQMAAESSADINTLRQWLQDGRLTLDLVAPDYIHFFERMTALAKKAGFEGLLVLADEIQQYIEPEVKSGAKDPIAPLFNVVQGLATRRNHLAFGLILIIPLKELSVIVDQRGDFVDRMRGLALDLGAIYNQAFPGRLWDRLAKEFDFAEHAEDMVADETLDALGQISIRDDLSNGPRTVVNAFRRIARRYLERPDAEPYSPEDLVDDFLSGAIRFDGVKRLQEVTNRALGHGLVDGDPERERAIKLAAGFPEEGATRSIQRSLAPTFDELFQSGGGELVIRVGDVRDPGFTLLGLERGEVKTDWLTLTVREFSRTYYESAEKTTRRAVEGFLDMLVSHVFRSGQWKVIDRLKSRLTQNAGLVLEGAFPGTARCFPSRRVHVRILMEDKSVKGAAPRGEVVLEFRLRRYLDWEEEPRRYHAEPVELDRETHTARFTLNLMSRRIDVSRELDEAIGKIVSPFKLTPLLLLTLHEVLNEKRRNHQIPKEDDQLIEHRFQPVLLDNALVELLRPQAGAPFDAAGARLVEIVLGELLKARYGDDYHTLMAVHNWKSSIKKYVNALHRLETLEEKQGQVNVEGLKEDIARLFPLTNTGLDSFMDSFPEILPLVREFPTRCEAEQGATGAVRFQLHPLESEILGWLKASPDTTTVESKGKSHTLHRMPIGRVYARASKLGYKGDEVEFLLDVMEARALIDRDRRGNLREALRQIPSVDEVADAVDELHSSLDYLQRAFPRAKEFERLGEEAEKYVAIVEALREEADEKKLVKLRRTVNTRLREVRAASEGRQADLRRRVAALLQRLPGPNPRRRKTLETQVAGVKYADQVNNLRVRLLRKYTRFSDQVDELRRDLKSVEQALDREELPLTNLARQAAALRDLGRDVTAIHDVSETLGKQYRQFTDWDRLVEDGAELFDELQMLGDPAEELMKDFDKLSRDVRGEISARALDALPEVVTYASRLNELRTEARHLRDQAAEAFYALQDRYRRELAGAIGYPQDRLWDPLIYSPLNPQGIYQQLYHRVAEALTDVSDRLHRLQSGHLVGVHNLLNTPRLSDLPSGERQEIVRRGRELRTHLDQIGQTLAEVRERAADLDIIRDFPAEGEGGFRDVLVELGAAYEQLDEARRRLDAITEAIRRQALSPEEAQVWEALEQLPVTDGFADLTALRAEAGEVDDEALWSALRGLWERQRVQIQVHAVRYDE